MTRGMVRALGHLSDGFARFAKGDFAQPIPVSSDDEVGRVARDANQMADNLKRLADQRDRNDWLKAGQVGLSDELRGELVPDDFARRALAYLVGRVKGLAGALYVRRDDGGLQLFAHYGLKSSEKKEPLAGAAPEPSFADGEGLLGRAAASGELLVVEQPPPDYFRIRSGLGEATPTTLVILPLLRVGRTVAIVELAMFEPCSPEIREWLIAVRETLVMALESARSGAALRDLLDRTQKLAERLTAQEEELRSNNQELQVQQEELRQANGELEAQRHALGQKNGEIEEARRRLQEKAEELGKVSSYKSQFLANMSHELRTPLNSMLLLSHLLGENDGKNLTGKQVEYAKTIHSAGQDLLALINQVLDLSKIEAGKQELDLESTPLAQFVDYVRRIFGPLANSKGLELVTQIEPSAPAAIFTDKLRVERILTNLIGNAIKFTEKGSITLSIGRPPAATQFQRDDLALATTVAFAVTDTGIGIAPELQERAFAPFEQLQSQSDRRYAGTGLGLTISRESAGLLGGELQLSSVPQKGSTFTCFLPDRPSMSRPASGGIQRPKAHAPAAIADDRATLKPTDAHLLLIEDDAVLAEQLVDIIRARGLKVVLAGTGEEGLELAKERRPQGIILDVRLPTIDGWTVMQLLRQEPTTRAIPVHFVSAVDAPERGLALGAVGYLTKPTTHAELAAAVRTLTSKSSIESGRILVVEDSDIEADSIVALLRKENLESNRVKSANAALTALESDRYGCMILDLGLPDMDGLGLLETLSAREFAMPKVVVHTARALTKKETQRLEAYAQAVIMKDGNSDERLMEEIRLFVRHVKESLPSEKQARPVEQPSADVSLHGMKILLAEDDMRTVYALSALLRGKGADVVVADNGREALEMLAKNPDVRGVLMDIMMPEMDGYEAMRRLRQQQRFAELPVIALTAKAMKGERERCLDAGASDYLTKPVDSQRLLTTLQGWLIAGESNGTEH
jgi:CheY-like chemotaxis protein/signal transduction histidine kinase